MSDVDAQLEAIRARLDNFDERLVHLRQQGVARLDRLVEEAQERLYRADVVNPLPADAPAGQLMVTPGDIHLYVGTGAGKPLRRIPTEVAP